MSALDIDRLLTPVAEDNPAGDNLEYDPGFMEFERLAQGKPEQRMGAEVIPAVEPDWAEVESRAEELLGRTKDLRVAVHLARAALRRHGFAGLADGLVLVSRLLEQYWDGVHPRLDPDDDNDPTFRLNCLMPLADPAGLEGAVRTTPIVKSPVLGQFSFRDHLIATGELSRPEGDETPAPESAHIEGAFAGVDLDVLTRTGAALESSMAGLAAIGAAVTGKVGSAYAPDLDRLQGTLRQIHNLVAGHLARRGVGVAPDETAGAGATPGRRSVAGEVSSREDVVAALERVCEYYRRHEPSSPVPLLLRRAQKLAHMDFMEILREMTPSGVAEAETIGGVRPESDG